MRESIGHSGYRVLWRGVFPTLIRDVIFSAVYWMNYETLKDKYNQQIPSFSFSFVAGAASGVVSIEVPNFNAEFAF